MAAADQEPVLIGLCDGPADPEKYPSSWWASKIGGSADRLPGGSRPRPDCVLCGAPLVHVVQVYCPLGGSPYHRTLHLFACSRPACSGEPRAWRVFRSQALETEDRPAGGSGESDPAPLAAATDWCDAADDWGDEEDLPHQDAGKTRSPPGTPVLQLTSEVDVSDGLRRLRLRDHVQDAPLLLEFYISVVEESQLCGDQDPEEQHAQRLLREYESREGPVPVPVPVPGGEQYEKSRVRHGDAAFRRFMKRVSPCPQQILRYRRDGDPLFISDPPADLGQLVPVCGGCGSGRTFELQLMPALVGLLRPGGPSGPSGPPSDAAPLEFGTVLVFTCRGSCWTPDSGGSPREEFAFLQEDPDQQLFVTMSTPAN